MKQSVTTGVTADPAQCIHQRIAMSDVRMTLTNHRVCEGSWMQKPRRARGKHIRACIAVSNHGVWCQHVLRAITIGHQRAVWGRACRSDALGVDSKRQISKDDFWLGSKVGLGLVYFVMRMFSSKIDLI